MTKRVIYGRRAILVTDALAELLDGVCEISDHVILGPDDEVVTIPEDAYRRLNININYTSYVLGQEIYGASFQYRVRKSLSSPDGYFIIARCPLCKQVWVMQTYCPDTLTAFLARRNLGAEITCVSSWARMTGITTVQSHFFDHKAEKKLRRFMSRVFGEGK